jgi:translation initiation factor 3 subunit L
MYISDSSSEPTELELPNQWLWDIIDEFIYQFQAFCQYRSKVNIKSAAELETLKERPDVCTSEEYYKLSFNYHFALL